MKIMLRRIPSLLLVFASLPLTVGGFSHAVAFFSRTLAAIAQSNLPPFYGNSLKLLWLADSSTMFILAAIFGLIAARPAVASRPVVLLVALLPPATALP